MSFRPPEKITPSAWHEHAPFAFWLVEQLKPKIFVELGTHSGFSYFAFCQAIRMSELSTAAFAVDHWTGDEHASFYGPEVYQGVEAYNRDRYSDLSTLMKMTFVDALPYFEDGSVDLLHIDGRHHLEDVRGDFKPWLPKLSNRAVVLFHDINVREREFGVHRFWSEVCEKYPNFSFIHGHGLGVLGVGKNLPPAIAGLFRASSDETVTWSIRAAYARLGGAVTQTFRASEEMRVGAEAQSLATRLRADLEGAQSASNDRRREHEQLATVLEGEKATAARANEQAGLLRQEAETLRAAVGDREAAAARLTAELDAARSIAQRLESERDQLAGAFEAEKSAAARANEEEARLQREIDSLRGAVGGHEAGAAKLRADLESTQAEANVRKIEIERLSDALKSEQSELRDRDREIDKLSRDIDATRLFLRESQSEIQRLAGERDDARVEAERAIAEQRRASEEHRLAVVQFTAAREEIAALDGALEEARQEARWRGERINDLSREARAAAAQAAKAQAALLAAVREKNELLSALTEMRRDAQQEDDRKQLRIVGLVEELESAGAESRAREEAWERVARAKDEAAAAQIRVIRNLETRLQATSEEKKRLANDTAAAVRELETRLQMISSEKDRLATELAHTLEEKYRFEQSAVDRVATREAIHVAALAESENRAQARTRALRDQLVDTETALAKKTAERNRPPWKKLTGLENRRLGRRLTQSGLFDTAWYVCQYPEVTKNGRVPVEHYMEEGYLRGYLPNPLFDTRWYLQRYEDVRLAGINPLVHYLKNGYSEGRNPGPEFETDFYLLTYPDVRNSGINPLAHFLQHGKSEGRLPKKL